MINTPRKEDVQAVAAANQAMSVALQEISATCKSIDSTLKKANNLDVLSQLDGTADTYYKVMKKWFEDHKGWPATLNALLEMFYGESRDNWHGWTDFLYTGAAAGTKGGDNANKTCTPSTNTVANTDDYAGLPLFAPIDCNWTVDETTLEPVITAVKGIAGTFENTNAGKFVGVLQQSAWVYQIEGAESWRFGYCSRFINSIKPVPLPEAVKLDGSVREFVVHPKYPGDVINDNGTNKWACRSGVIPTGYDISHNALHTISGNTGTGISGKCYCDWDFLRKMMFIKYGSLTLDGILQGCVANNHNGTAQVSETGVKRILLNSTDGAYFKVGMGVLIGTDADRSHAVAYSISGKKGCIVTAVENVNVDETDYVAVYVDIDSTFDTTAETTKINTFYWPTGSCDNILGNDGSPADPGTGVYPAKLQGIEFGLGGLEVLSDAMDIYTLEDGTYYHQLHFVDRVANQYTALTDNYKASGFKLVQPGSASYQYIKHMKLVNGVFVPSEYGGSSSTYFKDANYVSASATGAHEVLVVGGLGSSPASGGLSFASLYYGLTYGAWSVLGGPSPNGNRGEWAA